MVLFLGKRKSIHNLEFSPNRVSIGFSQIAFPIIVLPKDDRTNSAQEERLGLPYWTMVQAVCVLVGVSKYLDILIVEFSIILEHLPFYLGISRYCIRCCPSHPGTLDMISITFAAVIYDVDDPCSVNTA